MIRKDKYGKVVGDETGIAEVDEEDEE